MTRGYNSKLQEGIKIPEGTEIYPVEVMLEGH